MRTQIHQLWTASAPLAFTAALMLFAFFLILPGIWLDQRIVTGAPVWLKPAKFAISTVIFAASMAWVFSQIEIWPRTLAATGWAIAAILLLENVIIDIQAARGTTSHFNVSTPLDAALWYTMGAAIGTLLLLTILTNVALFARKFEDPAWGWALRLGLLITVLGSSLGGMMSGPTPTQSAELQVNQHRPTAIGAHTVGAPDGGPGLPGVGWSREHGDLRIPHFLGLHALQLIPLFCWLFARGNLPFAFTVSASYLALLAILTWQALAGESIAAPSSTTMYALGIWLLTTTAATAASLHLYERGSSLQPL